MITPVFSKSPSLRFFLFFYFTSFISTSLCNPQFPYLRRISKADNYKVKVRTLAKYLLEIGVLEWCLIAAPPSLMAAAAIWLARMALGMEQWVRLFLSCILRF